MENKEANKQKSQKETVQNRPVVQNDENTWAMFCHLSAFAMFAVPFGSILGPLLVWMLKKEDIPTLDKHGKAALNFHISIAIYTIIAAFLVLIVIGILFLILLAVFQIIMIVVASIKAYNGDEVHYPMSIQFFK